MYWHTRECLSDLAVKPGWDHTRGGDESVVTKDWGKQNIQKKHGALGKVYPDLPFS